MLWFLCLDPRKPLDFALELRLAKSHRFADYCPNVETLPRGERRGEEKEAQRGEGERWSAQWHTCSILCTCHNTAQHCNVCLSWSFHQETAPLGILLSQSQLFVSKPQATLLRNRFWNFLYNKQGTREDHNKIYIFKSRITNFKLKFFLRWSIIKQSDKNGTLVELP